MWWLEAFERHGDKLIHEYAMPERLDNARVASILRVREEDLLSRSWPLTLDQPHQFEVLISEPLIAGDFDYYLSYYRK